MFQIISQTDTSLYIKCRTANSVALNNDHSQELIKYVNNINTTFDVETYKYRGYRKTNSCYIIFTISIRNYYNFQSINNNVGHYINNNKQSIIVK